MNTDALNHVLKKIGNEDLVKEIVSRLSPSEISTLMLAVCREITDHTTPQDILKKYGTNRFVKPSRLDPVKVKQTEIGMLGAAQTLGFSPVLLSPAGLLGSCSVTAKVDQSNVISAGRGTELLADGTNMLALYLADGIKRKAIDNTKNPVHLATTCRVTRAQKTEGDTLVPHFSLISLVSSGRDTGSYGFEKEALARHLKYYIRYFETLGYRPEVSLNRRGGYTDAAGFFDRMRDHLCTVYPAVDFLISDEEADNRYYLGLNFKIHVNGVSITDGGFVDWTQRLLGNRKERLLISGAGIDLQYITGLLE